jgi:hypothetical protein
VHQRIIIRTRLLSDGRFSIAPAFVEITKNIVAGDNRALISSISINKLSYVVVKTLLIILINN